MKLRRYLPGRLTPLLFSVLRDPALLALALIFAFAPILALWGALR